MATHSSVLAWRIPGTGEPDGLRSTGSHRVGHDWSDLAAAVSVVISYAVIENGCLILHVCGFIFFFIFLYEKLPVNCKANSFWSNCCFLVAKLCPSLCDPMDCSLPGSPVHGIFQARVLEWGAIAFSEPPTTLNIKIIKHYTKWYCSWGSQHSEN